MVTGFLLRFWAVASFLALAVGANWLTSTYGLIPVGLGLTATAGTWAAGLVLLSRDVVHDLTDRYTVILTILTGAGIVGCVAAAAIAAGVVLAWSAYTIHETGRTHRRAKGTR